ncbi:MAG TPA: DUF6703 family protein [Propionibacteriaceae bacterium]|nr:DUF6703 family protein [Propionibacteriaceae bacterium]
MSATPVPPDRLRTRVERVSRPALIRLQRLPKLLVPLATVALVLVGVLAPLPVGLAALTVVWLFVAWIAYLSWPVVGTGGRVLRVFMLLLLAGLGATLF